MFPEYLRNELDSLPASPTTTGITIVSTSKIRLTSIGKYSYEDTVSIDQPTRRNIPDRQTNMTKLRVAFRKPYKRV